jgi:integrase
MSKPTATKVRRRSAGEGSTYEQGGRWRGRVTWTNPDGTRGRRYVSGATQAEARDKLDELRRDLRLGTLTPAGAPVTVGDYVTGWLERHRTQVRPSTFRTDETYVRRYIVPSLGRIPLARLMAADVERALGSFVRDGRPGNGGHPVSAVTAGHVRATLRSALAAAERDHLGTRNAARDARPPLMPHRDVTYLDAADVRRLLEATRDTEFGPLWAVAVSTGLRRGELLGLRWADVVDGKLTVRRSVGRTASGGWAAGNVKSATSRRTIPLPAMATEALFRQRTRQDELRKLAGPAWAETGLIFTDEAGRGLLPERVSHAFTKARTLAGIPAVRLHDLRHSAATLLLGAGVPMAVISEWLGHGDIGTTARYYAAVTPRLRDEARDAMDRALLAP